MPTSPQAYHTTPVLAYSALHLAANATTIVKTGNGLLNAIVINTRGISVNTISVYDGLSASGELLAIIDSTLGQNTLVYDLAFLVGLTVVIATGTAADITVTYL